MRSFDRLGLFKRKTSVSNGSDPSGIGGQPVRADFASRLAAELALAKELPFALHEAPETAVDEPAWDGDSDDDQTTRVIRAALDVDGDEEVPPATVLDGPVAQSAPRWAPMMEPFDPVGDLEVTNPVGSADWLARARAERRRHALGRAGSWVVAIAMGSVIVGSAALYLFGWPTGLEALASLGQF